VWMWRRAAPPIAENCQVTGRTGTYDLDLDQAANATTIALVARRMGMPDHAVTVAIEAALQESGLHNLDHGDRDSVGLFQQRPSQGWGSRTQILDTRYAATMFLRHLARVPHWATRTVDDAAQAVQRSAAPDAYTKWEAASRAVAMALTGEQSAGLGCQFPDSQPVELTAVHRHVDPARGWAISSWLVGNARRLGIRAVTFSGHRWQSTSQRWHLDAPVGSSVLVEAGP
jgi:hypothetical protein